MIDAHKLLGFINSEHKTQAPTRPKTSANGDGDGDGDGAESTSSVVSQGRGYSHSHSHLVGGDRSV